MKLLLLSFVISLHLYSAVDFILPIFDNKKTYSIKSDLNRKQVVINFWASWCTTCIEEIPLLNQLYERYKMKDYQFIAINAGEKDFKIKKFLKKYSFKFLILKDKNREISKKLGVTKLPRTIIIDKNGKIIYNKERPPQNLSF